MSTTWSEDLQRKRKREDVELPLRSLGSAHIVNLVGRPPQPGVQDICGEYKKHGSYEGHPKFIKAGTTLCIHFSAKSNCWVLDLLTTSNQIYAFANISSDPVELLQWQVWDEKKKFHEYDPTLVATTAPGKIQVCGRNPDLDNATMNGEYLLYGMHRNGLAYQKKGTSHVIRFCPPKQRWLLDLKGFRNDADADICNAWADARADLRHPGNAALLWHVWEQNRKKFVVDTALKTVAAPGVVNIVGCGQHKENRVINGSYQIHCIHEGRPLYANHSTGCTIQYLPEGNRWGISQATASQGAFMAFAEAHSSTHPGRPELEWHLWERSSNRHVVDEAVKASTAPAAVEIFGRDPSKENHEVQGVYKLVGFFNHKPAYQMEGGLPVIRYWPPEDRWLLDRHALKDSSNVNGFANANGAEHPGVRSLLWHVWETQAGMHVKDERMICDAIQIPSDASVTHVGNHSTPPNVDSQPTMESSNLSEDQKKAPEHQTWKIPMPFGISLLPSLKRFGGRFGGA